MLETFGWALNALGNLDGELRATDEFPNTWRGKWLRARARGFRAEPEPLEEANAACQD